MIYRRSAQEIQLATGSRLGTFTLEICLPIHQDVPDYWSLQAMAETERKTICQCFTIPFTYNNWVPTAQWNLAAAWTQKHEQPDIETCKKALNRRVESSEDLESMIFLFAGSKLTPPNLFHMKNGDFLEDTSGYQCFFRYTGKNISKYAGFLPGQCHGNLRGHPKATPPRNKALIRPN